MEVVVITHKGGQRSDGSVSTQLTHSHSHTSLLYQIQHKCVTLIPQNVLGCLFFPNSAPVVTLFEYDTVAAAACGSRSIQLSAGTFYCSLHLSRWAPQRSLKGQGNCPLNTQKATVTCSQHLFNVASSLMSCEWPYYNQWLIRRQAGGGGPWAASPHYLPDR